jgi:uncharacterized protein
VWSLVRRKRGQLERDSRPLLLACGFCAGVMGGAFGMNGPALVVYGAMRGWSAQHFRATLQAYFLPASAMGMVGYWVSGLWGWEVMKLYLISLPMVVIGVLIGRWVNQRLRGQGFLRVVYVGLIVVGAILLGQAVG